MLGEKSALWKYFCTVIWYYIGVVERYKEVERMVNERIFLSIWCV